MDAQRASTEEVEMWMALAEHFLDTETRHTLPSTALACLQAGCDVPRAREVWDRQIAPVVGFNMWLVAGEWAGWDRDWLVPRALARRDRPPEGRLKQLMRRLSMRTNAAIWDAIERSMLLLEAAPVAERAGLVRDLEALARWYFDFCPAPLEQAGVEGSRRLHALRERFLASVEPATLKSERAEALARVDAALLRCRRALGEPG